MRTFERFPQDSKCKICGTNEDEPCVLVPMNDDSYQTTFVHISCVLKKLRYQKEAELFYIKL